MGMKNGLSVTELAGRGRDETLCTGTAGAARVGKGGERGPGVVLRAAFSVLRSSEPRRTILTGVTVTRFSLLKETS